MDIVLPFSQAHTQSLIAVTDALIQNGWQPPKFFSPYHQQSNDVGLKALSCSALTIFQEDLAALHGSHPTQDQLEAIDNVGHSTALPDSLVRFQDGLIVRNLQYGHADSLHSVDIRSSAKGAARHVDERFAQWSHTPSTGIYNQSHPQELNPPDAPSGQASVITEWIEEPRAPLAQTLSQVLSRDTSNLSRKRKSPSSIDSETTLVEDQLLPSFAYADCPSNTRMTRLPRRRVRKPVAADFFTPPPSLEPEQRERTPLKFNMEDIEDLIKEERGAAQRKDLWTIPEHEYNAARGIAIKGTAGKFDGPHRGFEVSKDKMFKKARSTVEIPPVCVQLDGRFLQKQFSPGQTVGSIKARNWN
ncbi:MAG: hypothetical protein Q9203_005886 [Teloschistes exilis]